MTDAAIQSISLVVIAMFSMIGGIASAYFSFRASQTTKQTKIIAEEVKLVAQETEKNTNSMKDALVEATRVAAMLKGKQDERVAGDERKAAEAEGRAEGRLEQRNHALDKVVTEAVGIAEGPVEGEVTKGKLIVEEKK